MIGGLALGLAITCALVTVAGLIRTRTLYVVRPSRAILWMAVATDCIAAGALCLDAGANNNTMLAFTAMTVSAPVVWLSTAAMTSARHRPTLQRVGTAIGGRVDDAGNLTGMYQGYGVTVAIEPGSTQRLPSYRVELALAPGGSNWTLFRQPGEGRGSKRACRWKVEGRDALLKQRLVDAGALAVMEHWPSRAELCFDARLDTPQLTYWARHGSLTLTIGIAERFVERLTVPQFRAQLDLLVHFAQLQRDLNEAVPVVRHRRLADPTVASCLCRNLGRPVASARRALDEGRPAEAILELEEIYARCQVEKDAAATRYVAYHLGYSYFRAGFYDHAIVVLERAYDGYSRALGREHADTLLAGEMLAAAYRGGGRLDDGIDLAAAVIAGWHHTVWPEHPHALRVTLNLGSYLHEAGRHDEAVPVLEAAFTGRARVLGDDHDQTLTAGTWLADAYAATAQPQRAITVASTVLAARRRGLGEGDARTRATESALVRYQRQAAGITGS